MNTKNENAANGRLAPVSGCATIIDDHVSETMTFDQQRNHMHQLVHAFTPYTRQPLEGDDDPSAIHECGKFLHDAIDDAYKAIEHQFNQINALRELLKAEIVEASHNQDTCENRSLLKFYEGREKGLRVGLDFVEEHFR